LARHEGLRPDLTFVHRRGCVFGDANGLASHPRAEWPARAREADLRRIADPRRSVYFAAAPEDLERAGVRFDSRGLVARARPAAAGGAVVAHAVARDRAAASGWVPPAAWPRSASLLGEHPKRYDFVTRKLAVSYSDAAARAYLARGDFAAALAWFEDAARVGFDMPEAQWNVAVTAAAAGDPDRALDALLAARAMAPGRAESASRLALFLASAGRHADAARWFERAFRAAPSAALAEDASRAWRLAGDPARARTWADRAAATGRIG
ncbi:MAG TPA: tetratricopeptide repeat protein, partial [Candidatus Eisenbacteria bacterium]|nr:tetratricopeptide repeat protein [Candidatus Eisenbacteria bacterium]